MSLDTLMTTSVSRYAANIGQDASGGMTTQPPQPMTQFSQVPAMIQPASSQVVQRYANRQLDVSHCVYMTTDIQARPLDLLIEDSSGRKLLVVGYREATAGYGLAWVADVRETL